MTAPPGYELGPAYAKDVTGIFYRAVQLSLDRAVTIKMLRDETIKTDAIFNHFVKEISIATSLEHANLLLAVDSGVLNGRPYLVTEPTAEPTLAKALEPNEPLTEMRAVQIALGIGHALRHLEGKRFIYKNLRPQNVLLPRPAAPKLLTFRYVKPIDEAQAFRRANVQSAGYCAPELVRGDLGPVSARANVYALGAILYQMLAGAPPIEGESAEVRRMHARGKVPPLRETRPYMRERAYTCVSRLMTYDPAKRPDPAAAIALLEAYAKDPLLGKTITPPTRNR